MVTETKRGVLEFYNIGRKHYKLTEFEKAKSYFVKALKLDPTDGPSKVYFVRCKHSIDNPPPEDWDGVFVMQSK
jgi:tetratricopeptide (TPR) repeat protein